MSFNVTVSLPKEGPYFNDPDPMLKFQHLSLSASTHPMPAKTKTTVSKPAPRRVSSESVEGPAPGVRYSAFTELGFKKTIDALCDEIRELYLEDQVPWILGYSGGKDSTATLQLI